MGHNLVQNILLIAGFAIVAIITVTWVGNSLLNKEADTASCVEGASTYSGTSNISACNGFHSKNHSFSQDNSYQNRY